MPIALNYYTLNIPAGTVTPQFIGGELDWGFEGRQDRRVTLQLGAAGDTVLLEGTLDLTNWFALNPAITGDVIPHAIIVQGPMRRMRVTKTGTAGIGTVVAII